MGKTKTFEVKFTVSDYCSKKIIEEFYKWFPPDYRILFLNKNTSLHIFTPWTTLVAYFFIGYENMITIRLTSNWGQNDKNILLNCIMKVFNWEYIPDRSCCGLFAKKDELKFKM